LRRQGATISVVIPTMDRYEILSRSLPLILKYDFDEVIVVDSSGPDQRRKNEELCRRLGVEYYHFVGNREEARNFGVEKATGEWVSIRDDDIKLISLDMKTLRDNMSSSNCDFIHATAKCVWVFRRDFFLKIGGYDTKLCYGDDTDITYRAYRYGKACKLNKPVGETGEFTKAVKMHWKGIFSYSLTVLAFFKKYPSVRGALAFPYGPVFFLRELLRKRTRGDLIKFFWTTAGSLFSPLYLAYPDFFNRLLLRRSS